MRRTTAPQTRAPFSHPWQRPRGRARPQDLRNLRAVREVLVASTTGVVLGAYLPAGEVSLGSFAQAEPGAKELERCANLASD